MAITVLPWHNASELAFVRDCFYTHHAPPSSTASTVNDIYAPPEAVEADLSSSQSQSQSLNHPRSQARAPSKQVQAYESGLRRVAIWTFKSPRSVPHAVSATAGLVEAKVCDERGSRGTSGTLVRFTNDSRINVARDGNGGMGDGSWAIPESALRSIYAMAFLRFVNGFVDRDVSRSAFRTGLSKISTSASAPVTAGDDDDEDESFGTSVPIAKAPGGESSMYAHAVAIGMPSSFVDLRHRCVHGEVPELKLLRVTCGRALEWLWERWWKGNATGDGGRWVWEAEANRQKWMGENVIQSEEDGKGAVEAEHEEEAGGNDMMIEG